ncbi:MAG: CCA tRNA nucleotidyltransferase [Alphaproteobacteria bacterium]|nr:CCA tRNA nucleotidyltransferase [Alphaproteobacteria bacterium]
MTSRPPARLNTADHPWMAAPALRQLFDAAQAAGAELRVVGGAVRNTLLGAPVHEIDCAINVPPEKCENILQNAGIKTVRTGFEYGTITAVTAQKGGERAFEITSLRADIRTDGRRANVTYTTNWEVDAQRRDFTINALYVDSGGKLYDYCGGADDLRAQRIRFIGDPAARIAEDHLRILRFFRFHAWYGPDEGRGAMDAGALAACAALAESLRALSAERVWQELRKLLAAPRPAPVLAAMIAQDILQKVLPEAEGAERLARLAEVQRRHGVPDLMPRMAALLPAGVETARQIAARLRFSHDETEQLLVLARAPALEGLDDRALRALRYRHGERACRFWISLAGADGMMGDIGPALQLLRTWQPPVFPLGGEDVLARGIKPGPRVGALLQQVEAWWAEDDFAPARDDCLAKLQALI